MENILLLSGAGVGGVVIGGLIVYLLMRARLKSLKEDLSSAKSYIEKLENQTDSKVKVYSPKKDKTKDKIEETKETPIKRAVEPKESSSFKDGLDDEPILESPAINSSFNPSSNRLEDLKNLSKVVEEVESLTIGDDIFDEIDNPAKSGNLMVFERGFDETPNIKRENFKEFAKKRVLVAEDNPVNSKLITILFSKSGIDVDVAEDGLEALSKVREAFKSGKSYDLVLMDVHMPKMDGLEATMAIREDNSIQNTPIIALTASIDEDEVRAILNSGMNGYLSKPVKLGKVYTAFSIFLKNEVPNIVSEIKEDNKDKVQSKDLKVLNIQDGIEHTNHDKSLYKAILHDFLKNYSNSARKFKEYLNVNDIDSLKSLVIDLEGLAGTIGAESLYSTLKSINESLAKGDIENIKSYSNSFEDSLEKLLNATKLYLNR